MAAQNVGAHRWDRVEATTRHGVGFNFLLTGALIVPLILLDRLTCRGSCRPAARRWKSRATSTTSRSAR